MMIMIDANKARDDLEKILNAKEYTIYYNDSNGFIATWWEKAKEWISSASLKSCFLH